VERADPFETERTAAVIDLSRARPSDIPEITRFFRDGLMHSREVWDRARFAPQRTDTELLSALGRRVSARLRPQLIRTTRDVGCAFTNLLDLCDD
jgi:hypothetical protein